MAERYSVPVILAELRAMRAHGVSTGGIMKQFPPNLLYARCEQESRGLTRALYGHAMVEAGYVLDAPDGDPYKICPVCGFHFEEV